MRNIFKHTVVAAVAVTVMGLASPSCAFGQVAAPSASAAASAPSSTDSEYLLGAGDVVRISVFQNPDLTLEVRVSENGVISYPLLGNLRIGGKSVGQAERLIADGLRNGNFVKQPQVSLLVLQVRGNQASVLGQVNRPGRFPIEVADMRMTDLLANAGGVAVTGADTVTLVGQRNGVPFRKQIDLPGLFRSSGREDDVRIENGDVLYVERAPMVYIYGEVQRPGPLRLERGMTVMQALAAGGGLTQRGTEKGLRVHRRAADGRMQIIQPSMDDTIADGDVVYVRESLF
ncbi:polysaccharide export protein EpsE [Aquincola tertiaricarbonis]|uniref:Polysaccharide export protein EpsE n=1 Tax=Aquincola tertiaricarbonis TaxID=391953 RepID=A0ABY4SDY7_AQUTE|nr:polysaccharide export protein EpsE [Aquincola tertiaricarbonis]URI09515.1 polysaccharide export protein EpsE [Aquincola tertiaricarbonis]